jgi:glycosyltransferase involved in cell wall biosynthesis
MNISLTILIPVFNEERTVEKILQRTSSLPIDNYEIIVVNDASSDKSEELIQNFCNNFKPRNPSIKLITHSKNRGKGAGIKTALEKASGEYFVVQDADLEYDPKDIKSLIDYAKKNKSIAVYGSRFKGVIKNMPKPNYYANRLYNFILRRLYPTDITDMHTCYKMVKTETLKSVKMQAEGFEYATELVSKLLKRKIVINEVPISFNGRTKKQGKKINFTDGVECLKDLFKYRFYND